jgi:2-polyprenyl-3-methyl-5-hydroxy-6-metoxy-1,4-benzoquinol methylase
MFLSRRPTRQSIGLYYPSYYQPYSGPSDLETAFRAKSPLEKFLEKIESPLLHNARFNTMARLARRFPDPVPPTLHSFYEPPSSDAALLDFGCGSPWFLNNLRDAGWKTIGMDVTTEVVDQVRDEGHQAIMASEEGWSQIPDGSLSTVRMNHVLEHLYDPKRVLDYMARKLKPGGALHVAIPNPSGLSALFFRSHWWGLEAPRHLMLYTPRGLEKILKESGFTDIRIHFERSPKDFVRSLGYFLCEWKLISPAAVQAMGEEPLLNGWLAPVTWLFGWLGFGDRIHAFARRATAPLDREAAGVHSRLAGAALAAPARIQ